MSYTNDNSNNRIPLCCEICVKNEKNASLEMIKTATQKWLFSLAITITLGRHDPSKINCETLSKNCEYIVIEPAIPIKIVKEYNENFESASTQSQLITTRYSIYEVNSYHNLVPPENAPSTQGPTVVTPPSYANQSYVSKPNEEVRVMNQQATSLTKKQKLENFRNEEVQNDNIKEISMKSETTLAKVKHIGPLRSYSRFSTNIATTTVYKDPKEFPKKENTQREERLLFTIPVIGEKAPSSMEEDPIILPNFCCIVYVVTYFKNVSYTEDRVNKSANNFEYLEQEEEEDEEDEDKRIPIYTQYVLPHIRFHKLWDSLYYEENIKKDLLEYISALMLFATKKIDTNLINYNRLILFYGPPGTGKTSLCKALANKVAIRLSNIYTTGLLIELNTHTLFSKFFSESGKKVTKLFKKVRKIIRDHNENDIFICLLIDEVESLSSARKKTMDSGEPTDSIRVVNTLLTEIDSLKYYHNTLLLTTSNMTEMIDEAFIDRVDLKQFVGLPNEECRYEIFKGCVEELMEKGIVDDSSKIPNYQRIKELVKNEKDLMNQEFTNGKELLTCVELSKGFSGRCLRKIPFQAYAYFCQATLRFYNTSNNKLNNTSISIEEFLEALKKAIQKETSNKNKMCNQ